MHWGWLEGHLGHTILGLPTPNLLLGREHVKMKGTAVHMMR